jgi:hypothetical protein
MTRPAIDWIQDNMINPGYLDICVTMPQVLKNVQKDFDILGCHPQFSHDWRWFKSLHGKNKKFNAAFEGEYHKWCHGFLSYEMTVQKGSVEKNLLLESYCIKFIDLVKELESTTNGSKNNKVLLKNMINLLRNICKLAKKIYTSEIYDQLQEGCLIFENQNLQPIDIKNCKKFNRLFGRETLYISLEKVKRL